MRELRVVIPGPPHGQGRPRTARFGKHVRIYDPAESCSWKAYASGLYLAALQDGSAPAFDGPVCVEILAVWPCPKSARKADKAIQRPRVGKPDADNIAKAVCDAGNGVLWVDDAQVAELVVRRIVGREGEAPRVEVVVRPCP